MAGDRLPDTHRTEPPLPVPPEARAEAGDERQRLLSPTRHARNLDQLSLSAR